MTTRKSRNGADEVRIRRSERQKVRESETYAKKRGFRFVRMAGSEEAGGEGGGLNIIILLCTRVVPTALFHVCFMSASSLFHALCAIPSIVMPAAIAVRMMSNRMERVSISRYILYS